MRRILSLIRPSSDVPSEEAAAPVLSAAMIRTSTGTAIVSIAAMKKTKLHLHAFDLNLKGVQIFLSYVAKHPDILQKSLDTANAILYDIKAREQLHSWEQYVPRSITVIVRSMEGVAYTSGKVLDDDHKEIHISAEYLESLLKSRRKRKKQNEDGSAEEEEVDKSDESTTSVEPTATPSLSVVESAIIAPTTHAEAGQERDIMAYNIEKEIHGVLVHEIVHCIQFNGQGTCPGGLIEGIADWVRLCANLAPPHWKPYDGGRDDQDGNNDKVDKDERDVNWDAGYDTTAYFLEWLERRLDVSHLVPRLNQTLASSKWHKGKPMDHAVDKKVNLDELWSEYCSRKRPQHDFIVVKKDT